MDLDWMKKRAELREERMCTQLAQAELVALKQQVQPHFLYNSLNTVSSLIREGEGTKAVEALAQLSQLLRRLMAYADSPEIELRSEFDYAQCYLQVEKVRYEEKLQVHFDADERCLGAFVPTLILQPLVENAVKHGIAQRRNPGRIAITAHCDAATLILKVTNDPAEGGRRTQESDNHGIGLSATRARLERTFGADHRLDLVRDGPEGTVVTIELPLQFAKTPPVTP
jgi:LytS/YehU family sensor histidine kinase